MYSVNKIMNKYIVLYICMYCIENILLISGSEIIINHVTNDEECVDDFLVFA